MNYHCFIPIFYLPANLLEQIITNKEPQGADVAVKGVVEVFKAVKREKDLHQEILAFSIYHDHITVRIYGRYALIDGSKITFYRHSIKKFDFTSEEGKDKWTAYKFTKTVHEIWTPIHLKRVCSVVDQLPPDLSFEVSDGSELKFAETLGLLQEFGRLLSEPSNIHSALRTSQEEVELAPIIPQTDTPDTPDTSVSQRKVHKTSQPRSHMVAHTDLIAEEVAAEQSQRQEGGQSIQAVPAPSSVKDSIRPQPLAT